VSAKAAGAGRDEIELMRTRAKLLLVGAIAATIVTVDVGAARAAPGGEADRVTLVGARVGVFDQETLWAVAAEYRWGTAWWHLHPWAGALVLEDGAHWLGGGLRYEWEPAPAWEVAVGFAPGYYGGVDRVPLGESLIFASSLQVSYTTDDGMRFGAMFAHYSNASRSEFNPGTELFGLFASLPLGAAGSR
jgi:Lipid A 3-O-deacylase (PagL)